MAHRTKKPPLIKIKWKVGYRDFLPMSSEVEVLTRIAAQPGNFKSAKRAKFILWYAANKPKPWILEELKVSGRSLQLWYQRWVEDGIEGLMRLGKCSIDNLIASLDDPALRRKIWKSVRLARQYQL